MKDSELGIDKPISRRDFVGGVAVAISGSLAWRWSEAAAPADAVDAAVPASAIPTRYFCEFERSRTIVAKYFQ